MMKEKYETLPLTTLKELAKARGLKGISTMKKVQVIELMLQEDEKEQEKEKQDEHSGNLALYAGYSDYIWNCGVSDALCSCNEFHRLQRQKTGHEFCWDD